jgi:hypothetical protein
MNTTKELAPAMVRILLYYSWHLEMHKKNDFHPMYVLETLDEDGRRVVVEEKTLERLPPWEGPLPF